MIDRAATKSNQKKNDRKYPLIPNFSWSALPLAVVESLIAREVREKDASSKSNTNAKNVKDATPLKPLSAEAGNVNTLRSSPNSAKTVRTSITPV